jgi:MerR family transcriptional regulator/heat shock protein HspR
VNLAGVEIILNMREKMEAMQRQIESFVANLNKEISQHMQSPRLAENQSLIPVVSLTSLTTSARTTAENKKTESKRRANR